MKGVVSEKGSKSPRVLVTGTGGLSGISVLKALGGKKLEIFSADVDPHAPGLNLVDEDRRLLIPSSDRESWTELVYELCERHRINVLIPTADSELLLLASARVFFAEIGTKIVLASERTLGMCLDRWALHRRCKRAVRVPDALLADEALADG
jgi:carbamoyl-phosphate synthase large subunit